MSTQVDTRGTRPGGAVVGRGTSRGAPAGRGARPTAPATARAALLVAEREITTVVRTKSFLVSTAILLVGVLASIIIGSVLAGRDGDTRVAVVGATADAFEEQEGFEAVDVADEAEARRLVEDGDVRAAVLPAEDSPVGVRVLALDSAPLEVVSALSVAPDVELLEEPDMDEGVRYLVSFGFGLVFLLSAAGFGSMIAQNTVTEKQSRIVEILLATVSARSLLAGKILGNSVLAFGQTAAIAAVAVIALVVTGQDDLLALIGAPVVWFVLFFLVGFVLLAAMFAAAASLVSRMEDIGSVMTPVIYLTMTPYFLVVFFNDNPVVLRVMSYVPFSAPVGMPVRLFLGEAAWWEPLVALALLAAAAVAVVALGAKVYERSLLRTGGRVKLREALRGS
ncbi:ABC transporter permease [Actinotalea sp. Marseille-Q4924]|uniref:ABC transporter permease n=1 Tax=Actinotalea sp. Marseille-Q4924 TaxID=2866571 RepID=UPI001CE4AD38|nr:ABC transporter permease [Actinotalea sp. Marseille-Q4924]